MTLATGYKLTGIGRIPLDWEVSSVGQEFDVQLGKMLDSDKNQGVEKPYIGNRFVQWGRIDTDNMPLMRMSATDLTRYRLRDGDILVCEGGEVGRSALWKSPISEAYYQKALHRLRARGTYDTRLALALFQYWSNQGMLSNFVTRTSIAHLTKEKLLTVPMVKPPIEEQQAIAAALSDIDDLIVSLEALVAKKRDIKQAMMQQLLTGRTRLPGFSEAWQERPLASICDFITKGSTPTTYGFHWQNEGVLFLRSECAGENGLDLSQSMFISAEAHSFLRRSEVKSGDIVLTITGNVGRAILLDENIQCANMNQHLARIRVTSKSMDNRFVYQLLCQKSVRRQLNSVTTGQAFPQIGLKQVRELMISVPEQSEQVAIAENLAKLDMSLSESEAQAAKMRLIKIGMMQQLLTGRIRLI